jgi:hypothetical protein
LRRKSLIHRIPGRLAVVAVVAETVFSAISGSTIATTAMLGSLMLPIMLARGYHPRWPPGHHGDWRGRHADPPSALTVLLGSLSGISISKLLVGGVVPGLFCRSPLCCGYCDSRQHRPATCAYRKDDAVQYKGWARWNILWLRPADTVSFFGVVVGALATSWATPTGMCGARCFRHHAAGARYYQIVDGGCNRQALQGHGGYLRHDFVHHSGATTFAQILPSFRAQWRKQWGSSPGRLVSRDDLVGGSVVERRYFMDQSQHDDDPLPSYLHADPFRRWG